MPIRVLHRRKNGDFLLVSGRQLTLLDHRSGRGLTLDTLIWAAPDWNGMGVFVGRSDVLWVGVGRTRLTDRLVQSDQRTLATLPPSDTPTGPSDGSGRGNRPPFGPKEFSSRPFFNWSLINGPYACTGSTAGRDRFAVTRTAWGIQPPSAVITELQIFYKGEY